MILLKGTLVNGLYQLDLSKLSLKHAEFGSSLKSNYGVSSSHVYGFPIISNSNTCSNSHFVATDSTVIAKSTDSIALAASSHTDVNVNILHKVLGHPNHTTLLKVCSTLNVPFSVTSLQFCDACKVDKMHQFPHVSTPTKSSKPFDLVHNGPWRPASTSSSHGFRYYIHFVENYTRYTWIYPLTQV